MAQTNYTLCQGLHEALEGCEKKGKKECGNFLFGTLLLVNVLNLCFVLLCYCSQSYVKCAVEVEMFKKTMDYCFLFCF